MPGEIPVAVWTVRLVATPVVCAEALKGVVVLSYTQTLASIFALVSKEASVLFGQLYFHLISPDVKSFHFTQSLNYVT